jgi:GNAT superfamily N-acetyltransferase
MSEPAQVEPGEPAQVEAGAPAPGERGWRVRPAFADEVAPVAAAVARLLEELGSTPPAAHAMETAARTLIEDDAAGAVLVADAGDELVGVLAASWQVAIHVPGRYALVQDLWVDPAWRSRAIGRALLDGLFALAAERGVARAEVGIPRDGFPALAATRAFYERNGFAVLGARMRRVQP